MAVTVTAHEYKGAAAETTIIGAISAAATTITCAAATNWPTGNPGPFAVVIDQGLSTEEKVLITSRTGNVLTVAPSGRGWDNTSAASHTNAASISHCLDAWTLQQLNNFAVDLGPNAARTDVQPVFTQGLYSNMSAFVEGSVVAGEYAGGVSGACVSLGDLTPTVTYIKAEGAAANIALTISSKGSSAISFKPGDTEQGTWATDGTFSSLGIANKFGAGALGGTGSYLEIGSAGDLNGSWLEAKGSASNINLNFRAKGTGGMWVYADGAFALIDRANTTTRFRVDSAGSYVPQSTGLRAGSGASGGSGGFVGVADLADSGKAFVWASSSATNYGLEIQTKGSGTLRFTNGAGSTVTGQFDSPTGNFTSFSLRTTSGLRTIEQDAVDTAGTGYRRLRIAN